eukprot:1778061-Amphidinium_carterae.1
MQSRALRQWLKRAAPRENQKTDAREGGIRVPVALWVPELAVCSSFSLTHIPSFSMSSIGEVQGSSSELHLPSVENSES